MQIISKTYPSTIAQILPQLFLRALISFALFAYPYTTYTQLIISQACFNNHSVYQAPDNTFPDFIEIQNTSKDSIDLNHWLISDDDTDWKHRFTKNPYNLLAPGQSKKYLCDKNAYPYSLPFQLGSGETIYLKGRSSRLQFSIPQRGFNTLYIWKENKFISSTPSNKPEPCESSNAITTTVSLEIPERKVDGPLGIFGNQQKTERVKGWFNLSINNQCIRVECLVSNHSPDGDKQKSIRIQVLEKEDAELIRELLNWNQTSTNHFILRNGGEDGWAENQSGLRNILAHTLSKKTNVSGKHILPYFTDCKINGAFLGSYWLYPQIDENIYKEASNVLKRTSKTPSTYHAHSGNWENFKIIETQLLEIPNESDRLYHLFKEHFDAQNYYNYHFFQIFIGNQDRYSNNLKIWKSKSDFRWRYFLWDLDWAFGRWTSHSPNGSAEWNALEFSMSEHAGWTEKNETKLFAHLVQHPRIREEFIQNALVHLNTTLDPQETVGTLDSIIHQIQPKLKLHFAKFNLNVNHWKKECDTVRTYLQSRTQAVMNHFSSWTKDSLVTVGFPTIQNGNFHLQGMACPDSILWLKHTPIPLNARPKQGYKLSNWQGDDLLSRCVLPLEDISAPSFNLLIASKSLRFHAIRATPSINESEWVEIKNTSDDPIDIFGTQIRDGNKTLMVEESFLLQPNETVRFTQLPFKLDKDGERLSITLVDGSTADIWDYRDECLLGNEVVIRFNDHSHSLISNNAGSNLSVFANWLRTSLDPCLRGWSVVMAPSSSHRLLSSPHLSMPAIAE